MLGLTCSAYPVDPEPVRDTSRIGWEYDPDTRLISFAVHVSRTSGVYGEETLFASLPAIPDMVTTILVDELSLPGPGTYYVVVQAMSREGNADSGFSNEITLVYGEVIPPPPPLDPWEPPPPPLLPPPRPPPILPPWTPKPPGGGGGGGIPDNCMWRGGIECRP